MVDVFFEDENEYWGVINMLKDNTSQESVEKFESVEIFKNKVSELEKVNASANGKIADLERANASANGKISDLERANADLEAEIKYLKSQVNNAK